MGLQGVMGEMLVVHCKTPWGPAESAAWDWFWGDVEAAMSYTIEAHEVLSPKMLFVFPLDNFKDCQR